MAIPPSMLTNSKKPWNMQDALKYAMHGKHGPIHAVPVEFRSDTVS